MTFLKRLVATAGVIVMAGAVSACSPAAPAEDVDSNGTSRGGTLHLGVNNDILSWDTTAANNGTLLQPYQAPYDTLIRQLPDGSYVPMLATAWEFDETTSTVTMDLETGVTFSDGEPFDAEAVKTNLEYFAAGAGPTTAQIANTLTSVEVVDEDTVAVQLNAPLSAIEYLLSGAAGLMASPAAIAAGTLQQEPIGTGPYVMEVGETVAGSQYVFSAREGYWAEDLQKWSDLELIYLEDTALVNGLISGQVDATLIENAAIAPVEGAGMSVVSYDSSDWEGLILLDRDGALVPAMADPRVRQAMNYALDREGLNEALQQGTGVVTTQMFSPESGFYVDDLDEQYAYDPEKAKELLADAGYPDGFELRAPVPGPMSQIWALIGQQFADVGITVTQESIAFPDFRNDVAAQKYPVALFRYGQGDAWVASIQSFIAPTATVWNPFTASSPELEELIGEMPMAVGEDYVELGTSVNEYVTEEAWFAPFYRLTNNYGFNPELVEVEPSARWGVPQLYDITPAQG